MRTRSTTAIPVRTVTVPACSIDDCPNPANAAGGLCRTHYARKLRTGTTDLTRRPHRVRARRPNGQFNGRTDVPAP